MTIKIGITDCGEKYPIYEQWILNSPLYWRGAGGEVDIQVIKLSYELNNLSEIKKCDGILLTGGEDIHPKYYKKTAGDISQYLALCNPNFMDEKRDAFEWEICKHIFETGGVPQKIPVLGICRGLQLVNVFLGGTLIADIPSIGKNNHSKFYEGKDRYHKLSIIENSALAKITKSSVGFVNSAHHQSADILGKNLAINALSDDNIIEGLEWEAPQNQYLMLVQWHPERIENAEQNAFSSHIRQDFIQHIQQKKYKKMLDNFLTKLQTNPNQIEFSETIALIDNLYDFTPTAFQNGDLHNEAGQNSGSCKLFSFGKINQLSVEQTLACFGDFYRKDVLENHDATNHQNIRNFIKTGWEGISFVEKGHALSLRAK